MQNTKKNVNCFRHSIENRLNKVFLEKRLNLLKENLFQISSYVIFFILGTLIFSSTQGKN